jgi:hypothetical protein
MIGFIFALSTAFGSPVFDSNVPEEIKNQMLIDMNFIGSVQGSTASGLHQRIFGSVTGQTYLNFFNTRIHKVGKNGCGDKNAVACVIPFMASDKMYITDNYIKFSHPQVARSMVVFHESRHSEVKNGNWAHAHCPQPFNDSAGNTIASIWTGAILAGEPACDITPFGSYGSSMIMLKNISKYCVNCSEKVRMDAGIYADDQFKRIINPQAIAAIKQDLY